MPHPLTVILSALVPMSTKKSNTPETCPWCSGNYFIKYGKYYRFSFQGEERCAVQRYQCKCTGCKHTFSVPPHPFLRYVRFPLCVLCELLEALHRKATKTEIGRVLSVSSASVLRMERMARRIFHWINHEPDAPWAPSPCIHGPGAWETFIKMFSWKFYPDRYGHPSPTQFVYGT